MVTLEQVKLLETKVAKAIDFVNRVTEENSCLKGKLEDHQKRIDELEVLIQRFKDEQSRIEDGILNALERLSQFEAVIENGLSPVNTGPEGNSVPEEPPETSSGTAVSPEDPHKAADSAETGDVPGGAEERYAPAEDDGEEADEDDILFGSGGNGETGGAEDTGAAPADEPVDSSELDIF
jgi:hypothetical protein